MDGIIAFLPNIASGIVMLIGLISGGKGELRWKSGGGYLEAAKRMPY